MLVEPHSEPCPCPSAVYPSTKCLVPPPPPGPFPHSPLPSQTGQRVPWTLPAASLCPPGGGGLPGGRVRRGAGGQAAGQPPHRGLRCGRLAEEFVDGRGEGRAFFLTDCAGGVCAVGCWRGAVGAPVGHRRSHHGNGCWDAADLAFPSFSVVRPTRAPPPPMPARSAPDRQRGHLRRGGVAGAAQAGGPAAEEAGWGGAGVSRISHTGRGRAGRRAHYTPQACAPLRSPRCSGAHEHVLCLPVSSAPVVQLRDPLHPGAWAVERGRH